MAIVLPGRPSIPPPKWALLERHIFDAMADAADAYVATYTRPDGTLVWHSDQKPWLDAQGRARAEDGSIVADVAAALASGAPKLQIWPGVDGSDDGYESFTSFPLFYLLGARGSLYEHARKQWGAMTWQFTQYGQVLDDFDKTYDWMHHGESSLYLYFLALADPKCHQDRERCVRFAQLYIEEKHGNWDAERRMIRSPLNGSGGALTEFTEEQWCTHREVLADYLPPFRDMLADSDPQFKCLDLNDDAVFEVFLSRLNERMVGDVPLNLTATSLVTNAFLYGGRGAAALKDWVLQYLQAWEQRAEENGGIIPDNIGPSGKAGECMPGNSWSGGYYGWRWPHGSMNLLEATLIAGCNALLLTGERTHLKLLRSQLDVIWAQGKELDPSDVEEGGGSGGFNIQAQFAAKSKNKAYESLLANTLHAADYEGEAAAAADPAAGGGKVYKVPCRHTEEGWCDFRPPKAEPYIFLHYMTFAEEDAARLEKLAPDGGWKYDASMNMHAIFPPGPWYSYAVQGVNDEYPEQILEASISEMAKRLAVIAGDDVTDHEQVSNWDVHHWQDVNPVMPQPLCQLLTGCPGYVYHGGLLHTRLMYHDLDAKRPGLPPGVAALVSKVGADFVVLQLVNVGAIKERRLLLQAGAFCEHEFVSVSVDGAESIAVAPGARHVELLLEPAAQAELRLRMKLYTNEAPQLYAAE